MDSSAPGAQNQRRNHVARALLAALVAAALTAILAGPSLAASPVPTPQPNPNITISAHALMGGHVRPGAWTAVEVEITNSGPAVTGELRIRGQTTTGSQYGIAVQLATDAHKSLTLYSQTAVFGSRVTVELVSGDQVVASQQVPIKSHDSYSAIVAVVAEQPQGLLPQVTAAMVNPNYPGSTVVTITPHDLPPRVEAWAAIDRLVWQDSDASQLTKAQAEALRLWLGAGGRLTIVGGTTGTGTVSGFDGPADPVTGLPEDPILPFSPTHTLDVAPADLVDLVGQLPSDATTTPALAGTLRSGTVLARSGNDVIAAESGYGRGTVTLIGFNPATDWLADGSTSSNLWHRLIPQASAPVLNPLAIVDDSQIVYALQNLPSIDLPPIEQLFILLLAYIALIGPINYLILRRLDKREWAWITIPALVIVFAAGSYGMGATLKGSDVIVNEVGVVRAAQGTQVGIGQVYIGIYSPSRRTFQVSIPGGALISNPTSQAQFGQTETPLDVLFGTAASHLRNFEVGFGVLRGFRAEAPAAAPNIESDLRLTRGRLQGTVTNRSDAALESVAIVFGGSVAVLRDGLGAGESRTIDIDTTATSFFGYALSERIFGSSFSRDTAEARKVQTRRAVIDQIFSYGSVPTGEAPLFLAWRTGAVLDIELAGEKPNRVGESLYLIALAMNLDPQQVFTDQQMRRSIVATDADQAWGDVNGLYLSRGTLTIETRPVSFTGQFTATSLDIALTQGDTRSLNTNLDPLAPLPANEQPDQDDPTSTGAPADCAVPPCEDTQTLDPNGVPPVKPGDDPRPAPAMPFGLPALQLFDHVSQLWVEFEPPQPTRGYSIANPERYVDEGGAVLYRFVNRADRGQFGEEQVYFQLISRIEGTIQ